MALKIETSNLLTLCMLDKKIWNCDKDFLTAMKAVLLDLFFHLVTLCSSSLSVALNCKRGSLFSHLRCRRGEGRCEGTRCSRQGGALSSIDRRGPGLIDPTPTSHSNYNTISTLFKLTKGSRATQFPSKRTPLKFKPNPVTLSSKIVVKTLVL